MFTSEDGDFLRHLNAGAGVGDPRGLTDEYRVLSLVAEPTFDLLNTSVRAAEPTLRSPGRVSLSYVHILVLQVQGHATIALTEIGCTVAPYAVL